MNNGTLENPAGRSHGSDAPDERTRLTKLKKGLLQAEVDIKVLNAV